jgi:dTDP-4-dehydrorhamnose 3,5-epimerase
MIEGVEIKELVTYPDEVGFFREVIRKTDGFFGEGFGQWSPTKTYEGAAKAWHVHQKQTDWWYVAIGTVKVVLHDTRAGSSTRGETMEIILGEDYTPRVLKILPGVAHGYKVLEGPAHVFYITSRTYDPSDEGRIAHDDPAIGYDWNRGPEIK